MAMLSLLKLILISTGLTCMRTRTSMGDEAIVVRVHDGGVEDPVHLDEPRGGAAQASGLRWPAAGAHAARACGPSLACPCPAPIGHALLVAGRGTVAVAPGVGAGWRRRPRGSGSGVSRGASPAEM